MRARVIAYLREVECFSYEQLAFLSDSQIERYAETSEYKKWSEGL